MRVVRNPDEICNLHTKAEALGKEACSASRPKGKLHEWRVRISHQGQAVWTCARPSCQIELTAKDWK